MLNIDWYAGSSFGFRLVILFRIAVWKPAVGMVSVSTFGRINRSPSVSTKNQVRSLNTGPPNEAAHWLAFENGRPTLEALEKKSLEFISRPFQYHCALPW